MLLGVDLQRAQLSAGGMNVASLFHLAGSDIIVLIILGLVVAVPVLVTILLVAKFGKKGNHSPAPPPIPKD
jgi:hypothetical protein